MLSERLLKDIDFIVELDKMKSVLRQTSLIDNSKRENDAEHSWHISVMALVLAEYANEKIDICKVIKMLLVHDLVEIYAGDTFCYDKQANMNKRERELKAADKIFGMLDEDKGSELRRLWEEFEEMKTKEAIFAASMDRLQPFFNNYYSGGGTWKKFNIPKGEVYKRIAPLKEASDELWQIAINMIEDACRKGYITDN
ncbi:HD domain-containing protein [Tepidimicrobium xylanilyticum]|uniref:Putative hydrolases of HD superfamily n=1 Tax=Tepidimicrobium xylanilyticum TaxID=1123352 RepID=A0A1H3B685_9FIRM|nr:HD domain-containing protein [Tepidimicrobium xylanilyticum]GMG97006.1 hydrolase [Tepidimicrobium xylanilyticum]SDX36569.1 putative hydrolases of HD superfamily [Tepidimicrobium xylanilyticum]